MSAEKVVSKTFAKVEAKVRFRFNLLTAIQPVNKPCEWLQAIVLDFMHQSKVVAGVCAQCYDMQNFVRALFWDSKHMSKSIQGVQLGVCGMAKVVAGDHS